MYEDTKINRFKYLILNSFSHQNNLLQFHAQETKYSRYLGNTEKFNIKVELKWRNYFKVTLRPNIQNK